jgi:hypothetical protein
VRADLRGFADDDTGAVIDKEMAPDFGARVDIDSGATVEPIPSSCAG